MRMISGTTGHVTNSSSQVNCFDRELFGEPRVVAFMESYGVSEGYVGQNLCSRSHCGSVLMTDEQKETARKQFIDDGYSVPGISRDPDDVVLIFGDEYPSDIAYMLCSLLVEIQHERGVDGASIYGGNSY